MARGEYQVRKDELQDPKTAAFFAGFGSFILPGPIEELNRTLSGLNRARIHYALVGDENYRQIFVEGADLQRVQDTGLGDVVNNQATQ